jgi:hypothetical protein
MKPRYTPYQERHGQHPKPANDEHFDSAGTHVLWLIDRLWEDADPSRETSHGG